MVPPAKKFVAGAGGDVDQTSVPGSAAEEAREADGYTGSSSTGGWRWGVYTGGRAGVEAGACRALESPPPCCPPLDKVSFLFTSATIGIIVRSSCPSPHGRIDGWELGQPKGDKGGEGMQLIDCSVEALDTGGGAAVVGEKGRRWRPFQRGARLGRERVMARAGQMRLSWRSFCRNYRRGELERLGRRETRGSGVTKRGVKHSR